MKEVKFIILLYSLCIISTALFSVASDFTESNYDRIVRGGQII